jgi:A/G-specific adenine glycosylase
MEGLWNSDKEMEIVNRLLSWYSVNKRSYPWRQTRDPYSILIAEIMLQRTKSDQVVNVYLKFLERYPNPHALSRSTVREIEKIILPLGLKWRAKKLWELGRAIIESFNGTIPNEKQRLLSLPGVGEYAASAVLCFAYGKDLPVIDSNVCRVIARLLRATARGEARRDHSFIQMVHKLHSFVPAGKSREYNWAMIDLAATVCTSRKPKCVICPLEPICSYAKNARI